MVPEVGYRFGGEELLLLVLERCALGLRYLDLQQKYHIHHSTICRGVNYFAKWFNENWGYLLRDNLDFWGDYLEDSRDAVKNKMLSQYDFNVDEEIEDEFTIAPTGQVVDQWSQASSQPGIHSLSKKPCTTVGKSAMASKNNLLEWRMVWHST